MNTLKSLAIAASLGVVFSMPAAAQTTGAGSDAATPRQSESTNSSAGQTAPAQSASSGQSSSLDRGPDSSDRTNWGWLGLLGLLGLGGLMRRRDEHHRYGSTTTSR